MECSNLVIGSFLMTLSLFGDDVEHDRFLNLSNSCQVINQTLDVMSVQGADIHISQIFKNVLSLQESSKTAFDSA